MTGFLLPVFFILLVRGLKMNNKVDDVLFSLLKAKENIVNNSNININDNTYKNVITGLDNIITDYTINNKMSNKEILDCALSLYERKPKNNFFAKLNNIRPKKIIENIKNKINENHKKKEFKEQYEKELVDLVKERLKTMINEDRKNKDKTKDDMEKDLKSDKEKIFVNNGIIDISNNEVPEKYLKSIPIYNKDIAEIIDTSKVGNFIFKDDDNYCVYRHIDNENKNKNISIVKFNNMGQAVMYAIDDKLSEKEVKTNFEKYKNNYGNLASYIDDKRGLTNVKTNIVNNIKI